MYIYTNNINIIREDEIVDMENGKCNNFIFLHLYGSHTYNAKKGKEEVMGKV